MKLFDAIVKAKFSKSKTEARKSILGRGIRLNDFTVIDSNAELFFHENKWLLVEANRLTVIDCVKGTVSSKDITQDEFKEIFKKEKL